MNCVDWTEKLHDYLDASLAPDDARKLEAHVSTCAACRTQLDSLRRLRDATRSLPRELSPARDLWPGIKSRLDESPAPHAAFSRARWRPVLAAAAAIAVLIGLGTRWKWLSPGASAGWSVASLAGSPLVGQKTFQGEAQLHRGQWLETDEASRAKVAVGNIGEVSVGPNSRLRLVATSATDHRLELARGTLNALIWAPPRLFFVNTPSATAIDLGCAYTLTVDDRGDGLLQVTSGYVALEHDGRESIIPAGLKCVTRQGSGPGTPFAADASAELRAALERFDFEKGGDASVRDVLAHARANDAITLWHLLSRAGAVPRGEIFDALAKTDAPPPGVTRAGIVAGDIAMRHAWATQLGLGSFAQK